MIEVRQKGIGKVNLMLLVLFFGVSGLCHAQDNPMRLKWNSISLFSDSGNIDGLRGVAGAFSGIQGNVLLVAGGTSFPDGGKPWNGSKKYWSDRIFVLKKRDDGSYVWLNTAFRLPKALAYGASVSVENGVICMGGMDSSSEICKEVLLLKWNPLKEVVEVTHLPDLPVPLSFMGSAVLDGAVYVAGGEEQNGRASRSFFKLVFPIGRNKGARWQKLPPWPGRERIMPVVQVQSNGKYDCLYMFSGRLADIQNDSLLFDGYCFDPQTSSWKRLSDVKAEDGQPLCLAGASSTPLGLDHILVFGGADSREHRIFRRVQAAYNLAGSKEEKDKYRAMLNAVEDSGYSKTILSYHTLTDRWAKIGVFPDACPVLTQANMWDNVIMIPGGEIKPAVRSSKVWMAHIAVRDTSILNWLDYVMIAAYFTGIFYIGYKYKKNIKTTNDYYKAGKRIPGWASGVSMFGTLLSAITFLTTPAKTFNENWLYFLPTLSSLIVAPFIVTYIIPVYLNLNVTTAYEYLEKRFSPMIRMVGSASFLFFHIAKFGVVLLLPALAIAVMTGVDPLTCIIVISLFAIIYGTIGGIEAVVWTEVLQVFVFLLAAVLSVVVVVLKLHGGIGEIFSVNRDLGKFKFINWHMNLSEITVFVTISYWIGGGMVPYIADQTVIQRYLVARDARSAYKGVWLNAILIAFSSVLFFYIGSALFAYYWSFPGRLNPTLSTPDAIYPWFIINEIPSGVKGIVVAGIFAVSMSTISSTMNSMSATVLTDVVRFSRNHISTDRQLFLAKALSVIFGILGTVIAVMMFFYHVGSLWDMIRRVTGLFMGGLAGLFLLGIFVRKANHTGALLGFIISAFVQYYVSLQTSINFMMYSLTGMLSCFIMGYITSLIFPGKKTKRIVNV